LCKIFGNVCAILAEKQNQMRYENSDIQTKGDLGGHMSVTFKEGSSLQDYCRQHVENYDHERFEAFTLRVLYGDDAYVTLYAVEKAKASAEGGELPVKKFRLPISFLNGMLGHIAEANVTLTTGEYLMEDMRVINK
jgi:hypothetical protein